jgi:hypothetical protein
MQRSAHKVRGSALHITCSSELVAWQSSSAQGLLVELRRSAKMASIYAPGPRDRSGFAWDLS